MPDDGHFYEYHAPPESAVEEIMRVSWEAFVATRGTGYARVDLRGERRRHGDPFDAGPPSSAGSSSGSGYFREQQNFREQDPVRDQESDRIIRQFE